MTPKECFETVFRIPTGHRLATDLPKITDAFKGQRPAELKRLLVDTRKIVPLELLPEWELRLRATCYYIGATHTRGLTSVEGICSPQSSVNINVPNKKVPGENEGR